MGIGASISPSIKRKGQSALSFLYLLCYARALNAPDAGTEDGFRPSLPDDGGTGKEWDIWLSMQKLINSRHYVDAT
jgi:hypothetical protein